MKYCLVVDAYSSGNLLAPEFRARGVKAIHVQSTPKIWPVLEATFRPEDFEENIAYTGDFEVLMSRLKPYRPLCVLPGTETGVPLADRISEALGGPTNGTAKSAARRNKHEMIETMRRAGLAVARQIKSKSPEAIFHWMKTEGLDRIVIKPVESAATEDFALVSSLPEIESAVRRIIGKVNVLGLTNEDALAQEYMEGMEYLINSTSCNGHIHLTDIWKYKKRSINGHDRVHDCNELVPTEGEEERELQDYVLKAVRALGIQWGPCKIDVMLTPKGPRLIEAGARLQGMLSLVPALNVECIGYDPLSLTVDAFVDPTAFSAKTRGEYRLKKWAYGVYLTSYEEGTLKAIPGESVLRGLPSFFHLFLRYRPGDTIHKTIDYSTVPGFVSLAHSDPKVLAKDFQTIRSLEDKGRLFELEA